MTLLDATVHLIDVAKQAPENRVLNRAIARMEKRAQVLRLRATKARRRVRHLAWWDVMWTYVGAYDRKRAVIECPCCAVWIDFGYFARTAELDGRGNVKAWDCGRCGFDLAKRVERHPDRNLNKEIRKA